MANLYEHVCRVAGLVKESEFHPALPVSVATSEDEVLGILLSRRACVE